MKYFSVPRTCMLLGVCTLSLATHAALKVEMHKVDAKGITESIGYVSVEESAEGLVFTPALDGLPQGIHGFHVHQNASCDPTQNDGKVTPAGAAGSHLDLKKSGHHDAPWADGHLGDLPALYVDDSMKAHYPVLAPRLSMEDIKSRALVIHSGGDNYSDTPEALGGGGARIACGIIRNK